jgi:hypothetical protein
MNYIQELHLDRTYVKLLHLENHIDMNLFGVDPSLINQV